MTIRNLIYAGIAALTVAAVGCENAEEDQTGKYELHTLRDSNGTYWEIGRSDNEQRFRPVLFMRELKAGKNARCMHVEGHSTRCVGYAKPILLNDETSPIIPVNQFIEGHAAFDNLVDQIFEE